MPFWLFTAQPITKVTNFLQRVRVSQGIKETRKNESLLQPLERVERSYHSGIFTSWLAHQNVADGDGVLALGGCEQRIGLITQIL